jgi:anti-sigma factor RsiW
MNGHEFDCTLLGAYALGALEPAEESLVEIHIATCDRCFEELIGFLKCASRLAGLPPEARPR